MSKQYTLKSILQHNQNWWSFYDKYKDIIRVAILVNVIKWLSCGLTIRGYQEFHCSNSHCTHTKRVPFTCKSRACSSCGKKATETWIHKQNNILPQTDWQHITFTMPDKLWDFFWLNRHLLNNIAPLAANTVKTLSNNKKLIPGIFTVIHTFGRDLKRNVHVHLSTTLWGISKDGTQFKNLFFPQESLMKLWRYAVIDLFRKTYMGGKLTLPPALAKTITNKTQFLKFLDKLYQKQWIVHCAKPNNNHKKNIQYLGRYVKRPPIAESKLRHYDGNNVKFAYLDHTTKSYRQFKCSADEFIARFIQHIPDINFRLIRYYGFLANRIRSKFLPLVYKFIQQGNEQKTQAPSWVSLMMSNFNLNPLVCILCQSPMLLSAIHVGKSSVELMKYHQQLALMKVCR